MGFAEVSLVFDNTARKLDFDADDVKVTRRYYRSGKSEYIINQAAVRLKDVQMLFMDTGLGRDGYSIIGQGRIGDIVSSKSTERREIFEEAAGIAKYRYRKNEAERRLASTEDNLLRLRDIVQELENRVGPLKQQAEKAKEFLELAGEKKELEIGLWLHTLQTSRDTLRSLGSKLELARTQYEQAGEAISEAEAHMEESSRLSQQWAIQMDTVRRRQHEQEEQAAALEAQAAVLRNDQAHNQENIARIQGEIAQSETGDEQLRQEIAARTAQIDELARAVAEKEHRQLELTEQIAALSREASAIALQISDVRVAQVTAQSSLKEIEERLGELETGKAAREQQVARAGQELTECEQAYAACCEQIESLQNELRGYQMRLQSREVKRDEQKQVADQRMLDVQEKQRRARILEDLERNMEGFGHSIKMVMQQAQRGTLRGIHGPVSRLLDADSIWCATAKRTPSAVSRI